MRRAFLIVVAAALFLALAWWIAALPGHVDLAIGSYSIATSAPVAILLLAAFALAIHFLLRLLGAILRSPRAARRWKLSRDRSSGDEAVHQTLSAIAAGDRDAAPRAAARARRKLGETPQTLLLSAESERLRGDEAMAAEYYRKLAERDDGAFLGLRGLFRQAMAREDWPEAARLAQRAERARPGAAWLREEREALAVRTGDWSQALQLAGPEASSVSYATAAAEGSEDPAEAMRLARQAHRDVPGFVPAALVYARLLRAAGREGRAQDVVRTTWKTSPHPDLATFVLSPLTDRAEKMAEAGRLVATNPASVESSLLLAKLNLDAGNFAEARKQAELARGAGCNQRRLWMLIADLESEERGATDAGRAAQRDALRAAAGADPDPVWRCEACGTPQAAWAPLCPACHTPGKIRWGVPRVVPLAAPAMLTAAALTRTGSP